MKGLIILTAIMTVIQTYRLSIYFLRKDLSLVRKFLEVLILVMMIVLCYLDLEYLGGKDVVILSLLGDIYVLGMFIYEVLTKKEYISILSVKEGIDMSLVGILFLDRYGNIILINNQMKRILEYLGIDDNYLDNLINKSFRKIDNSYLIKCNNLIYQLREYDKKEIILVDVSEIYNLQEEIEIKNKLLESNNQKIMETIKNIENIEKTKNLLKIKNEYHDNLGHRLALLTKYLEQDKKNISDIRFLLDSIYDNDLEVNPQDKLNNLVKMYYIIGINVIVKGSIPKDKKVGNIFFEIIREAITNAIIHADSRNIKIVITEYLTKTEMIITNDGKKPKKIIYENEGIKGMRRKLSDIGGILSVDNKDNFILKIVI